MRLEEFDYELPPELIAQEPAADRDASRLMRVGRHSGVPARIEHRTFADLPDLLHPGDLLVLNDTRVVPARLRGTRTSPGGSARVEALLVERLEAHASRSETWKVMARGIRRSGDTVDFGGGLVARAGDRIDGDFRVLELSESPPAGSAPTGLGALLERRGVMPLPPYIRREAGEAGDPRDAADRERYQTIFARVPGAVAAPTAGLHFTPRVMQALAGRGVAVAAITLHVGPGTFLPVRTSRVEDHALLPERFRIPDGAAEAIRSARSGGGRVIAVGTTVCRALESSADGKGGVVPGEGSTDLFIRPGFAFRAIDALVTNLHLPESTLLMLVSAFGGHGTIRSAYEEAVRRRYRFFSYGDAMLIA